VIRSAKKAGQVLLAVAAGFVVSFGATQAFATSQAAPLMYDCQAFCVDPCIEAGFNGGFCLNSKECACY
jgi:hypothetical protein